MGVPRFYRWISERYPKINTMIKEATQLPEFDHLYLDVNGIIHSCAGSNEGGPNVSESEIFVSIMAYLDRIVSELVKPKKTLFIAVDGVAPRAKLNQQRSRRFGSAKESRDVEAAGFDRNCITPGTAFMARVAVRLATFVKSKVAEGHAVWSNIHEIIVSGADVPGEGEHKIIQFIRERRPSFTSCERHCMYGQDADLIMLALCTHEPHFCLLREVIDFSANARSRDTAANARSAVFRQAQTADFQLLHLSILREYIHLEMCVQSEEETTDHDEATKHNTMQIEAWDLERLLDDFVLMTFFVGNDFLPHSPSLDIGEHAFEKLFQVYRKHKSTWKHNEYLTIRGRIADKARLQSFVQELADMEPQIFADRAKENKKRIDSSRRRHRGKNNKQPQFTSEQEDALTAPIFAREHYYTKCLEDDASSIQFRQDFGSDAEEAALGLGAAFVRGLEWCLAYYLEGCVDWQWFYPSHYCPLLQDVAKSLELPNIQVPSHFTLGSPLKPLEQLMSCLPPDSSKLLPKYYRELMLDSTSPVAKFYPMDFRVDMHGKRNAWEGVNLLPFIDMQLLLSTIAIRCPSSKLSSEEQARSNFGQPIIVTSTTHKTSSSSSVQEVEDDAALAGLQLEEEPRLAALGRSTGTTTNGHKKKSVAVALQHPESRTPWLLHGPPFEPALRKASMTPLPGYPSLHSLPLVNIRRKAIKLNCFGSPSRYTTLLLELPPAQGMTLDTLVPLLGKCVYVEWPLTREAKLLGARDSTHELLADGQLQPLEDTRSITAINEKFLHQILKGSGTPGDGGLDAKEIHIVLRVALLKGLACNAETGALYKVYDEAKPLEIPAQIALASAPQGFTDDPRFKERPGLPVEERFTIGSKVIVSTSGRFRGSLATVRGHTSATLVSVEVVETTSPMREPPFGLALAKSLAPRFASRQTAAKGLKLPLSAFDCIVGSLLVTADDDTSYDLGLRLRCAASAAPSVVSKVTGTTVDATTMNNDAEVPKKPAEFVVLGYCRRTQDYYESEDETDDESDDDDNWEYSAEAVRLVSAYRSKFPAVFEALLQAYASGRPIKKAEAKRIFGPDAVHDLTACVAWLAALPTHAAPRVPTTTMALGVDAVTAIQRAGAKRAAKLETELRTGPRRTLEVQPQELIPESISDVSADRVIRTTESNKNEALRLGDRVINLAAPGVPFGARGIVVARHLASGAVDVVFDEPFVNGSSLQGVCEPFRGALCDRSHLLAIRLAPKPVQLQSHEPNAYAAAVSSSTVNQISGGLDDNDDDDQGARETEALAASKEETAVAQVNNESDKEDKVATEVINDDDSLEDIPEEDELPSGATSPVEESKTKLKSNRVARGPERNSSGFDPSRSEGRRAGDFIPKSQSALSSPSEHWAKLIAELEESRKAERSKLQAEKKANLDSALATLTEQYGLNEKSTKKNRSKKRTKKEQQPKKDDGTTPTATKAEEKKSEPTKKGSLLSRARQAIQAKITPKPISILRREDKNEESKHAAGDDQSYIVPTPDVLESAEEETKEPEKSQPEEKNSPQAALSPIVLTPISPHNAMPPTSGHPEPQVLKPIPPGQLPPPQLLPPSSGQPKVFAPLPQPPQLQNPTQEWSDETDARLAALEKRARAALQEKQVPVYVNESTKVPENSFTYGFQPDLETTTSTSEDNENPENKQPAPKKSSFQYVPMTTTTRPVARKARPISAASSSLILPSQLLGKRRT